MPPRELFDSVTEAWAAEIRKRKSELRSGAVSAVPWDQARARLNARAAVLR